MASNNPYQSPQADVNASNETYQPNFFSMHGRIGRIRYLAFTAGASIFAFIPLIIVQLMLGQTAQAPGESLSSPVLIFVMIAYVVSIFGTIIFTKRRFNDLNLSGWFSLLLLIPLLNILVTLFLVFFPGSKTINRFGAKPVKNTLMTWLAGLIIPLLVIFGIIAAIAIPAYADYTQRVVKAQSLNQ